MKYLREFATRADYEAAVAAGLAKPNVSLVNESSDIHYNKAIPLGVFIQHIDGTLYTSAEWANGNFSSDEANGVAVSVEEAKFVIAKTTFTEKKWASKTSTLVNGVFTTADVSVAKTDYNGKANTEAILSIDKSEAAYTCANFVFPNGKKGYLAAAGEWEIVQQNLNAIENAFLLLDVQLNYTYHSSTQSASSNAYAYKPPTHGVIDWSKNNSSAVIPFTTIE